jgi:hypothetical protein
MAMDTLLQWNNACVACFEQDLYDTVDVNEVIIRVVTG